MKADKKFLFQFSSQLSESDTEIHPSKKSHVRYEPLWKGIILAFEQGLRPNPLGQARRGSNASACSLLKGYLLVPS